MAAGVLLSIFAKRRAEGFPVATAVRAQLFQRAGATLPNGETTKAQGHLLSKTVWGGIVGGVLFLAVTLGWIPDGTANTIIGVAGALGMPAANLVFRALVKTPTSE